MTHFNKFIFAALMLALLAVTGAYAQTTVTSTTLSAALAGAPAITTGPGGYGPLVGTLTVASATGITAPVNSSNAGAATIMLFVDREEMRVTAVSGTTITVQRGSDGTQISPHASGTTVWICPPLAIVPYPPSGNCTSTNQLYLPILINDAKGNGAHTGEAWTCPAAGTAQFASEWYMQYDPYPVYSTDWYEFVPAVGNCGTTVSGNQTANWPKLTFEGGTQVVENQTTNTGTNTQTYLCTVPLPSRTGLYRGVAVSDVQFLYGVQTSALGTQAATLASGTFNSSIVFTLVPTVVPGASETALAITTGGTRADTGTLAITPAAASANTATTTAGQFYSQKFAPSAPIALNTDINVLLVTVTLQCAATSTTITNTPGFWVHYTASLI